MIAGGRRDLGLELTHIDRVGLWIDIDEHRPGAHKGNRLHRSDKSVRHRDHLAANADPTGPQGQLQRGGPIRYANGMPDLLVGTKLLLESLHVWTQE